MRNMNKYIVVFAFLFAFAPVNLWAQATKQETGKAKAPMNYEAFFKNGMQKQDGLFPVYKNGQKYYIEIPETALGKDLLVSGRIVKGNYYGEVSTITNLLVFNLGRNNTLEVREQICTDRAAGDMAKAVGASSMQPVDFSYPIAAFGADKKSYIIDISSDLNTTGKLFDFPNQKFVNSPKANRSGVDSIYMLSNGVKFIVLHSQSDLIPGFMHIPPRDVHTSALIEWSLQLLPDRKIAAREADSRVGYASISYNDYDRNPYKVEKVKQIQRWHLEIAPKDINRYLQQETVEPINPIRVYLDHTVSSSIERRAILRAIEEWNKCFEAAGFKNALQVQQGEPEVSVAYHQIVFSYVLGKTQFTQISDTRTGEILSGVIGISNNELNENLNRVAMMVGGYEPKALSDSLLTVREEYIRYQASNLLGRMMGLIPNWGGSTAFTTQQLRDANWVREHSISSSVTDGCIVNYAAQPGDGMRLSDLFAKASDYDHWAIEWGYRQYPGTAAGNEEKAQHQLLMQAKDNASLYFCTQGQTNYKAVETDLGNDIVETAELGIQNLARLSSQISDIYLSQSADNDPWKDYIRYIADFDQLYPYYIIPVFNYIGGISVEPIIGGYNEEGMKFLPKKQGEKAMAFLKRHVFQEAPAWRNDSLYIDVIGLNRNSRAGGYIMNVAKGLMNSTILGRILEGQIQKGNNVYTLNDWSKALDQYVFLNYNTTQPLKRNQAKLQYNIVREFASVASILKAKDGYGDLAFYLVNWGKKTNEKLEYLSKNHQDTQSRAYYRGLNIFLTRALKTGKAGGFMDAMTQKK